MTMTRRDFLSASAAFAVTPVFTGQVAAAALPREADIVVIGAGAAGIAAARRIMAANRKVIVVEAASQIVVATLQAGEPMTLVVAAERHLLSPADVLRVSFRAPSRLPQPALSE